MNNIETFFDNLRPKLMGVIFLQKKSAFYDSIFNKLRLLLTTFIIILL